MDRYTLEYGRETKHGELKVFVYDLELLERVSDFYSLSNISLADALLSNLNNGY